MPNNPARSSAAVLSERATRSAVRRRLHALIDSLDRNLWALNRAVTPAAVHGSRVSARRLRVFLRVFLHAPAPTTVDRHIEALRQFGHYLDAVREADVAQEAILRLAGKRKTPAATPIAGIYARTVRERARAVRKLEVRVNAGTWTRVIKRLRGLAGDSSPIAASLDPIARPAIRQLEKRRRRLLAALRSECKTPLKLHRLRLKIKFLRYLCEEWPWPSRGLRELQIKQLRGLQNCLGELHDGLQLQEVFLTDTLFPEAARELSFRLAIEQRQHMSEFRKRRKSLLRAWSAKRRS
jgi:CHAD domain-containing protein